MFSNLIFLILILFIVNLAPSAGPSILGISPPAAFFAGTFFYLIVLASIVVANLALWRRFERLLPNFLVSLVLILALSIYHFFFVSHAAYIDNTLFQHVKLLFGLTTLFLYFGGLFVHLLSIEHLVQPGALREESRAAFLQIRFLLPFALPYLVFEALRDLGRALPQEQLGWLIEGSGNSVADAFISFFGTLVFLGMLMILMPALIQKAWGCVPLPPGELHDRLQRLCSRAGFKHAGMKLWTVMENALSAAIIGIVPRFRYVMFTKGLLEELSLGEIEAVMGHEMGHSKHKHLLVYPFIIFGMMLTAGICFIIFQATLTHFFALEEALGNGAFWMALQPFIILIPYALIIAVYFRLVFGFYSRLFERQADLYPIELGLPPEDIINALHTVGDAGGESHDTPNWHHFSLRQRMDYLARASVDASVIQQHHRRVRRYLRLYFVLLAATSLIFFSNFAPKAPVLSTIYSGTEAISEGLSAFLNAPLRKRLAQRYTQKYSPLGESALITTAFEQSLFSLEAISVDGVFEFYAAQRLSLLEQHAASLQMMTAAWKHFNFEGAGAEAPEHFRIVTYNILHSSRSDPALLSERMQLFEAMREANPEPPQSLGSSVPKLPNALDHAPR